MLPTIRAGVRRAFRLAIRRRDATREALDEELRFHVDARAAQLIARGWPPDAACTEALRLLGPSPEQRLHHSAQQKEDRMAMQERFDELTQDVRYAIRGLIQRPGFTIVAVLTLAIGIGANTAIFSAVDALLLRPLPFRDPAALMDVVQLTPFDPANGGSQEMPWSYPKFVAFMASQRGYRIAALDATMPFILTGDNSERIMGERVSAQFLTTLGASVMLGHDFPADEDAHPDAAKLAILGNGLWQRRYHADPAIIGQLIRVDSATFQVIGVLPPSFRGMSGQADILLPVTAQDPDNLGAWDFEYSLTGRLKPGVTVAEANADAKRVAPAVYQATPMDKNTITSGPKGPWGAAARPLNSVRVAPGLRRSLLVLFGAVGMVLLIACVNLANLLLARGTVRRHEIAIRLAVGAGRARLVRMLLAESLIISVLGGAASVALAVWASHVLRAMNPDQTLVAQGLNGAVGVVGFNGVHIDARALAFTFVITVTVGLLFGLIPALQATRAAAAGQLADGSTGRGSARLGRSRRTLVVVEVALALVLLVGSGLMIRSLANTLAIDPGFDSSHLLTLRLTIPPGTVVHDSMPAAYRLIRERLAALPGVQQAALADCPPLSGGCNGTLMMFPDRPQTSTGNAVVGVHWVTPSWFQALHIPLKRGRMFNDGDRTGAPKVVLISETAARRYWPHDDPIGKPVKVYQGGFHTGATVIGIVGDVRFGTIDSVPAPDVYISYDQAYTPRIMAFLRSAGDPRALVGPARQALHEFAPQDPVYDIATMADRVGAASGEARFSAILLGLFAAVALALATLGIYGVMSFGVAQRSREIGIRMALGAEQRRVLAMVVREGLLMAGLGGVIGLVGAFAATRILRTLLFGVTPNDAGTYLVVGLIVAASTVLASWIPARRAASVSPTEALRRG